MDLITEVVEGQDGCYGPVDFGGVIAIVITCCALGLLWSLFNVILVNKIDVEKGNDGESDSLVGDIS